MAVVFAAGGAGPQDIAEIIGNRSALLMEQLGDILNGMDAAEDDVEWMEPIFKAAHAQFPQRKTKP